MLKWGISGSFRAAQYASTFPKRVGNFILDSITPHGIVCVLDHQRYWTDLCPQDIFDQSQDMIVANNRALVRADAFCQNNASCPFRSSGRGSVPKVSLSMFGKIEKTD